jgi:TRAP-type C4-dicarboxylate transport system substrate-binding protein
MKRNTFFLTLGVFFLCTVTHTVFAQRGSNQGETVDIRFASPLPRYSDWGRTLDRLAAEWMKVTNNTVRVIVNHGGQEGSDVKMFSSLSANNIQCALFTSFGLADICPAVMTLSAPFLLRNDNEFDIALREAQPILDAQINKTNFVVIAWSKGGWINIFSKDPVYVPDDLRRHKLATNQEVTDFNTAFRAMGFNLVETDMLDLGTRIASNTINAVYQTPAAVAPVALHKTLVNMLDMPIAAFIGAVVVNRVTWNKLGPARQRDIVDVTRRIVAEFDSSMPRITSNAVSAMKREGLKVNQANSAQEAVWHSDMNKVIPSLLGTTFDRDVYNKVNAALEKSRSGR